MMTSYFNLLKYAATGQASPEMTYYDKMRASTLMGGAVQTLTGIPPLTFNADGNPLISWSMKGNGQQQGTPTPDAPIIPEFVGVRTGNLLPSPVAASVESAGITVESSGDGIISVSGTRASGPSPTINLNEPVTLNGTYHVHFRNKSAAPSSTIVFRNGTTSIVNLTLSSINSIAQITLSNVTIDNIQIYVTQATSISTQMAISIEQTESVTTYEPYGWKAPLTNAGQTIPVYLGEAPTVRRVRKLVLDGTENWIYVAGSVIASRYYRFKIGKLNTCITDSNEKCTHYQRAAISTAATSTDIGFSMQNSVGSDGYFAAFRPYANSSEAELETWKSFLAAQYAAGHPVTIWYVLATPQTGITNEPLAKIGDYADELSSEDAAVTIPTVKGQNVLTVDTPIHPSEMTITFKG